MSVSKAIGLFLLLIFVVIGAYYSSVYIVNIAYYDIYLPLYHLYLDFMTLIHDIENINNIVRKI